jgi:DNA-binding LytR/AlgR family response regulator
MISPLLLDTQINLRYAWWFQGITLMVAAIPASIFILAKQNWLLRKFSGQASEIEIKLQEKKKADNQLPLLHATAVSEKIILVGDYQKEILELAPADLFLISSASNYIKVFHRQQGRIVYSILRGTLKKTEEILQAHPNFFKCHRAYIVNLDKVEHIEGNAQGYKIKIDGYADLIPVSRNLNNEFSDKLLSYNIPRN